MSFELLTMGRISVDIYPHDVGLTLDRVESFGKYLGGSPSNVAVAAAKYGRSSAVITRTGADPFGQYLREQLQKYGVDDRFLSSVPELQTPATFCAILPEEQKFPLYFYGRFPTAPDLQIRAEELDLHSIKNARIFWSTLTGLSQEPSRSAHISAHEARPREELAEGEHTILDLDYRPMFWESPEAAREQAQRLLPHISVAIGNEEECAVAVGHGTPDEQADRLLEAGVRIAVVKLGPEGVMVKTETERIVSAPIAVQTLNGLGAGDAFGGAFSHGLLAGWPLERTLDFANAAGALVASKLSCSEAMPDAEEVTSLLAERGRLPRSTRRIPFTSHTLAPSAPKEAH